MAGPVREFGTDRAGLECRFVVKLAHDNTDC